MTPAYRILALTIPKADKIKDYYNTKVKPGYTSNVGSSGQVIHKGNSKIAIKISHRPDPAYLDFVKLVASNQLDCFPKIYRMLAPEKPDGQFLVVMEKLVELWQAPIIEQLELYSTMSFIKNLRPTIQNEWQFSLFDIFRHSSFVKKLMEWAREKYWNINVPDALRLLIKTKEKHIWQKFIQNLTEYKNSFVQKNPNFLPAIELLRKNNKGYLFDLRPLNVMYRPSTNQFVIIDPWFKKRRN